MALEHVQGLVVVPGGVLERHLLGGAVRCGGGELDGAVEVVGPGRDAEVSGDGRRVGVDAGEQVVEHPAVQPDPLPGRELLVQRLPDEVEPERVGRLGVGHLFDEPGRDRVVEQVLDLLHVGVEHRGERGRVELGADDGSDAQEPGQPR